MNAAEVRSISRVEQSQQVKIEKQKNKKCANLKNKIKSYYQTTDGGDISSTQRINNKRSIIIRGTDN